MFNPNQNQNQNNQYNPYPNQNQNNYNPNLTPNYNNNNYQHNQIPQNNSFDNRKQDYNEPLVGQQNQFNPYQTTNQGFPDMNQSRDITDYDDIEGYDAFDLTSKST
jgi:hypothetical protein